MTKIEPIKEGENPFQVKRWRDAFSAVNRAWNMQAMGGMKLVKSADRWALDYTSSSSDGLLYFYMYDDTALQANLMKLDLGTGVTSSIEDNILGGEALRVASDGVIYFADKLPYRYVRIGTDGSSPVRLMNENGYPGDFYNGIILVDDLNSYLFFRTAQSGGITRVDRTSSGQFASSSEVSVMSAQFVTMALDPIGGKIYWVEDSAPVESYIYRANMDGTGSELFHTSAYPYIQSLAVSPDGTKIFWTECAGDYTEAPATPITIFRGSATGALSPTSLRVISTLVPVADGELLYASGLAASSERVYFAFTVWGDAIYKGRISSIPHGGGSVTNHFSEDNLEPNGGLAVSGTTVPVEPPAQAGITPRIWLAHHPYDGAHKIYRYDLDGSGGIVNLNYGATEYDWFPIYAEGDKVFWFSSVGDFSARYWNMTRYGGTLNGTFNPHPYWYCDWFHVTTTKIFAATDWGIISWNQNGTGVTMLAESVPGYWPASVTVDETNSLIYFAVNDAVSCSLYTMALDGSSKTLLATGFDTSVPAMSVDPSAGYLFFYEQNNARIIRCNLSGGDQTVIVSGIPGYTLTGFVSLGSYLYYHVSERYVYRCNHSGGDITLLIDLPDTQAMHVG